MAYPRPTLQQLIDRSVTAITGKLSLDTPALTRAASTIIAVGVAGVSHGLHGLGDWLWRQIFPAESAIESLEKEAAGYGFFRNAATFAGDPPFPGSWTVTGTNGTSVPAGTEWARSDGVRYISTVGATVAGGTAAIQGHAVEAGLAGNVDAGSTLSIVSPIAGLSSTATVVSLEGGNDQEEAEDFRSRFIEFLSAESEIGADADWIRWARTVAGVTRAWVYRHEGGLGRVVVRFVRDQDTPSIIPSPAEVSAVQTKLDAERPTTAEVEALAPVELPTAFTIGITPDTPERRAAVESELADLFFRRAEPGDGAGRGTVTLSEMRTAVGTISPVYTMPVPSADVVPALGQLPTKGVITWS